MSPIAVILLRPSSRSCSTSAPDPYAHLLAQPSSSHRSTPSYAPFFVPILDTAFVNEQDLQGVIRDGPERWAGVVVTSQRAVDAWASAGQQVSQPDAPVVKGKGKARAADSESSSSAPLPSWSSIPFFSIGPSTTNSLLALPEHLRPTEDNILSPPEAGNTPSLANLIISHYTTRDPSDPPSHLATPLKPLLYLTGDKNSPVLSQLLAAATPPIAVHAHQTYLTSPLASFEPTFSSLLDSVLADQPPEETASLPWVVLFAPSAVELALPVLRAKDALSRVRFAVIGPTTGDALRKEHGVGDVLEAVRPGAGGLVKVLRRADGLM